MDKVSFGVGHFTGQFRNAVLNYINEFQDVSPASTAGRAQMNPDNLAVRQRYNKFDQERRRSGVNTPPITPPKPRPQTRRAPAKAAQAQNMQRQIASTEIIRNSRDAFREQFRNAVLNYMDSDSLDEGIRDRIAQVASGVRSGARSVGRGVRSVGRGIQKRALPIAGAAALLGGGIGVGLGGGGGSDPVTPARSDTTVTQPASPANAVRTSTGGIVKDRYGNPVRHSGGRARARAQANAPQTASSKKPYTFDALTTHPDDFLRNQSKRSKLFPNADSTPKLDPDSPFSDENLRNTLSQGEEMNKASDEMRKGGPMEPEENIDPLTQDPNKVKPRPFKKWANSVMGGRNK